MRVGAASVTRLSVLARPLVASGLARRVVRVVRQYSATRWDLFVVLLIWLVFLLIAGIIRLIHIIDRLSTHTVDRFVFLKEATRARPNPIPIRILSFVWCTWRSVLSEFVSP